MDAEDEPLEMVVDDEPLEERLSFVILSGEREHREIPGRRDRKDDESSGQESQAPQPVPFARRHAVDERHRAREGEAQQTLREGGEADEAVEGDRPSVAPLVGEHRDHEARHRRGEQPDENGIGHGLTRQHHEQRRGERRYGAEQGGAPRDEAARRHEEENGPERRSRRTAGGHPTPCRCRPSGPARPYSP